MSLLMESTFVFHLIFLVTLLHFYTTCLGFILQHQIKMEDNLVRIEESSSSLIKKTQPEKDENVKLTFTVEIPSALFQYEKLMKMKAKSKTSAKFSMKTPNDDFNYISKGQVNLPRVQVQYAVQSVYSPNVLCFYLYFYSKKRETLLQAQDERQAK